jgi:phosphorylcholine metabolism protein LicD
MMKDICENLQGSLLKFHDGLKLGTKAYPDHSEVFMSLSLFNKKSIYAVLACALLAPFGNACHAEEEARQVPTDFVRDVMQPMGVPTVSFFHAMRESLFLNTKVQNGHLLESIGDFFLTPSQYLFAGKKIIFNDQDAAEFEVLQTFQYDRMHGLKSLISIIALPFSQALGAAFKGLAYLSPEVRQRYKKIKEQLKSSPIKSHLDAYRQKGLVHLHSEEFIPCQGHKRPSGLTKKQKVEIQAVKEVVDLLEEHDIIYWIDCGTCLGAYRYGGIIPWDWDIDISILLPDHDNVKKILSNLDPEKYQIQDWSSYSKPKTFLKLYVKETKNFIDIYHYQINEDERTVGYLFTYLDSSFPDSWKKWEMKCIKPLKYEEMFPLKKAKFDHLTLWAPNHVVTFLQSKYGENLDPTMVWDEERQDYKKMENHPYYN